MLNALSAMAAWYFPMFAIGSPLKLLVHCCVWAHGVWLVMDEDVMKVALLKDVQGDEEGFKDWWDSIEQ